MLSAFHVDIYYEDTDFSGVVYHANYLKFIERARSDWIAKLGIDQLQLRKQNIIFVVRSLSATFNRPAYFGDRLEITTTVLKIGGASIQLSQKIYKNNDCIFFANVKVALVSNGQVSRLPKKLREKLLG